MHELTFPPDIQREMAAMWAETEKFYNDRETAEAKADPRKHKVSRVFEGKGGTNYSYWRAGKDGRGARVRFCWSAHRNVAGYFLGWREVWGKKQVRRDMWVARKSRKAVALIAQRRADAFRERRGIHSNWGGVGGGDPEPVASVVPRSRSAGRGAPTD